MMAVREGQQDGLGQYACVKLTDCCAKRFKFGVLAWGWPPNGSIQSLRSSIEMNRTFGFLTLAAPVAPAEPGRANAAAVVEANLRNSRLFTSASLRPL
jgi:hypothetical protein